MDPNSRAIIAADAVMNNFGKYGKEVKNTTGQLYLQALKSKSQFIGDASANYLANAVKDVDDLYNTKINLNYKALANEAKGLFEDAIKGVSSKNLLQLMNIKSDVEIEGNKDLETSVIDTFKKFTIDMGIGESFAAKAGNHTYGLQNYLTNYKKPEEKEETK
jgi:hypothetical protein